MSGADRHDALMDGVYRYQRHIYDLTRKYYLLGRDRMIEELQPPVGGRVLEVGCGTARNLIAVARRYPAAELYGFDISSEMLKTAEAHVERAGLDSRIHLAQGDATALDLSTSFGPEPFERVYCSYTLSMIPDWQGAIREGWKQVAPGGRLYIVDFGDQAGLPRWFRAGLRRWLAEFHVEPRDGLPDFLAGFAKETGATAACTSLYRGYAVLASVTKPAEPT